MTRLTFFALPLAFTYAFSAAALDLNGIPLDVATTREALRTKLGVECPRIESDSFTCKGKTIIETVRVDVWVRGHRSIPEAITISFPAVDFQIIGAAAILKWGKPSAESTLPMQNGFGARNDIVLYFWDEPKTGARVKLSSVGPALGECEMDLEDRAHIEANRPKKGNSL